MPDLCRVYIGYDSREKDAFAVCRHSILRHTSIPVGIVALDQMELRQTAGYRRSHTAHDGIAYDDRDGKPFSTEFAFTRFLVPHLMGHLGWALFMDGDMMLRRDIAELWAMRRECYAVMCVKHDYRPPEMTKKDGQIQERYTRKNWSSLVLWNCGHQAHEGLTPGIVNTAPGRFLHGFEWLTDAEIGEVPEEWNWLEGWSSPEIDPANVHFTRGGPWLADPFNSWDFADEWRALHAEVRTAEYSQAI